MVSEAVTWGVRVRGESGPVPNVEVALPAAEPRLVVAFDRPVRAPAPLQVAALYAEDDVCVGGGPIAALGPSEFELALGSDG